MSRVRVIAAAACMAAAATGQDARGADLTGTRVSDERTRSYWANANLVEPVRRGPSHGAPAIARLRLLTEDGEPEVYLVLRRHRDADGDEWLQVRIPGRPNGRVGWVEHDALGALTRVETSLVVDRTRLRATLLRRGRPVLRMPIGVGAPRTPTPAGRFYLREKLRVSPGNGPYGPWALGTSAYSVLSDWPGGGVVGIHGTNRPELVPGRPSHGCIRLRNRDVARLARLMPIGTPIRIR